MFVLFTAMNQNYISDSLSICSYNMHGFNQGVEFLKDNVGLCDIWCLQEHWLYPSTSGEFNNVSAEYLSNVICDVIDEDVVKPGRPKGGLAIMWHKSLSSSFKIIGSSINNRVMAAVIECDSFAICIFNVYLPCFEQSEEYTTIVMECLSYIDYVYELVLTKYSSLELCIIGDCNLDVQKLYNSQYVACMRQLLTDYDLFLVTKTIAEEGGYTYCNDKNNVYSMIDHCFMSRKLHSKCEDVAVIDNVDNLSDHLPVHVKLSVKVCHYSSSDNARLYAMWDEENIKMYYNNTRDGLYMLDDEFKCSNVLCGDSCHNKFIDDYCDNIIRVLHDSTMWGCVRRDKRIGNIAWSKALDEAKRNAKIMRKVWLQSGKRRAGIEFYNMNAAKREYKNELRKAKKIEKT